MWYASNRSPTMFSSDETTLLRVRYVVRRDCRRWKVIREELYRRLDDGHEFIWGTKVASDLSITAAEAEARRLNHLHKSVGP